MIVSKKGRSFKPGKALSEELRRLIVDRIVQVGGDCSTGHFPGSFNQIAGQLKVGRAAVQKIWSGANLDPHWKGGNNPPRIQRQDLDLIERLKYIKPLIPHAKLLEAALPNLQSVEQFDIA